MTQYYAERPVPPDAMFCEECSWQTEITCEACEKPVCKDHSWKCEECWKLFCRSCRIEVDNGEYYLCLAHKDTENATA